MMKYTAVLLILSITSSVVSSFVSTNTPSTFTRCMMTSSSSASSAEQAISSATAIQGEQPELPPIPPMSKRLFLVRHGEVINPGGDRPVYYGAQDVPLSPLGQEEAKAAALYLSQFDLEYVFASPLSRAVFGAEQVLQMQPEQAASRKNELVINAGFKELDRGAWCGLTKDEIGADAMASFDACDESITPDGGESYPFLKSRVLKALEESLNAIAAGQAGAVVSHLQVTRSLLSEALEIPTNKMAQLKVATASVTCIDYDHTGAPTLHFQSYKPDTGLETAKDGAN